MAYIYIYFNNSVVLLDVINCTVRLFDKTNTHPSPTQHSLLFVKFGWNTSGWFWWKIYKAMERLISSMACVAGSPIGNRSFHPQVISPRLLSPLFQSVNNWGDMTCNPPIPLPFSLPFNSFPLSPLLTPATQAISSLSHRCYQFQTFAAVFR